MNYDKKNWALIAQWEDEDGDKVDFSKVVPRMSVGELEKMVDVAQRILQP